MVDSSEQEPWCGRGFVPLVRVLASMKTILRDFNMVYRSDGNAFIAFIGRAAIYRHQKLYVDLLTQRCFAYQHSRGTEGR
jgi:hypothetical protein